MRIRFLASIFSFSTLAAAVVACSSSSPSTPSTSDACRHYFEAAQAFSNKCEGSNFGQTEREDRFLLECQAVLNAPGASAAATQVDECASAENALVATCDRSTPAACDATP